MTTTTQFTPTADAPFQFQATLTGPTANVASAGTSFTVSVLWNTFGQRWYIQITDQGGNVVVTKPLIASPSGYLINLVGGYFTGSTLVFLEDSQQFVVTP